MPNALRVVVPAVKPSHQHNQETVMATETIPTGKFVWFDYLAKDFDKAQGFYGELFNWKTQVEQMAPYGAYTMIAVDGKPIGGYQPTPEVTKARWLAHLQVSDARQAVAKVTELGGKVVKPVFKFGEYTIAIVEDPQGGQFAVCQPQKAEEEAGAKGPGSFVWNELVSPDPKASIAFYRGLAGYETEMMDMPKVGKYHILKKDGEQLGGIMKELMPGQPIGWLPYVLVENLDTTADKAKRLGAKLLVPPTEVPNMGRFAIIEDPQGASLGVFQGSV
jgi:predicted enzyme related to lactoylglutathione lyase